jgi:hypothetical protein
MKALVAAATAAVVIFGIAASMLFGAWAAGPTDRFPLDKACYSLFARDGQEFKSWYPPVPAADGPGVFTFNNDHTWGYVFAPNAMVADRDCLRERYSGQPDLIPPLEGSDD